MQLAADTQIRLGLWKIHILHHAAEREVWGHWLLEELHEHGHRLSPGTLYPALLRMEQSGWIERVAGKDHVRARQRYRLTPRGRTLLEQLRNEVRELCLEVVGHAHTARVSRRGDGVRKVQATAGAGAGGNRTRSRS